MENKVYYGEYSLWHWINLILKKNIILPEYQRYYVWEEEQIEELVKSLKRKEFIPPITIGAFANQDSGKNENWILDGQQRLTSILLAYIGYMPNRKFGVKREESLDNNDDNQDEEVENLKEWKFNKLFDFFSELDNSDISSIEYLITRLRDLLSNDDRYNQLKNINLDVKFLKEHYLGFSYIVPNLNSYRKQVSFYSSVFRNINIQGTRLNKQESRESLYYLDNSKKEFFSPKFASEIKADFVKYLALLSEYKKTGNINKVGLKFARDLESYYANYIYSIVSPSELTDAKVKERFLTFEDTIGDQDWKVLYKHIKEVVEKIDLKKIESIIDMDMLMFGLIYVVLFEKRNIDSSKISELKSSLESEIKRFKDEKSKTYPFAYYHKKSPNTLKYIRERLEKSIEVYREYSK